jgi:hypothetical protein
LVFRIVSADCLLDVILRLLVDLLQQRQRRTLEVLCLVFDDLGDRDASAGLLDGTCGTEVHGFFLIVVLGSSVGMFVAVFVEFVFGVAVG